MPLALQRARGQRAAVGIITLLVSLVAAPPVRAQAQSWSGVELLACRNVDVGRLMPVATVIGSLAVSDCGMKFTTSDPYVVLLARLRNLQGEAIIALDVVDPHGAGVGRLTARVVISSGVPRSDVWIGRILPIAATPETILAERPGLSTAVIRAEGRPARERLGRWTFSARIADLAYSAWFVLEAAVRQPSTPAPAPSPEPTPSP